MVAIRDYLSEDRVLFLETKDRNEALEQLIDRAIERGNVTDARAFREAVQHRESVVSTGIGQGIAVPHIKHASVSEFFITLGVSAAGIDWNSIDRSPVHVAFLIAGPEDHEHYLQILSKVMLVARNARLRQDIVQCTEAAEVLSRFQDL